VPVKYVTVGPRDPLHVTPLIKSMLVKRNRLRKKGRIEDANRLAEKINISIQDIRCRQYNKLPQASPKELWAAVKSTNGSVTQAQYPVDVFHDVESVNNLFVMNRHIRPLMLHVLSDLTYIAASAIFSFNPMKLNVC